MDECTQHFASLKCLFVADSTLIEGNDIAAKDVWSLRAVSLYDEQSALLEWVGFFVDSSNHVRYDDVCPGSCAEMANVLHRKR